jgi:hypothetical protein
MTTYLTNEDVQNYELIDLTQRAAVQALAPQLDQLHSKTRRCSNGWRSRPDTGSISKSRDAARVIGFFRGWQREAVRHRPGRFFAATAVEANADVVIGSAHLHPRADRKLYRQHAWEPTRTARPNGRARRPTSS